MDFLLYEQKVHDIMVVDFSQNCVLEFASQNVGAEYISFTDWDSLSLNLENVDLIISYKIPTVIPDWIIAVSKNGGINIHPSMLPKYKGKNPWYQIYYDGELSSGVTIHKLSSKVDGGNIIAQKEMSIQFGEPLPVAMKRSDMVARQMIEEILDSQLYLSPGKEQIPIQFINDYDIAAIRQMTTPRMWHLFRGFPNLISIVFDELPHSFFEVGDYLQREGHPSGLMTSDFDRIENHDGLISLIDFSMRPMASDYINAIEKGEFKINMVFQRDRSGQLQFVQGAESIVFFGSLNGSKKAVRLRKDYSKRGIDSYVKRIDRISDLLRQNPIGIFVKFKVVNDAILTDKGLYPAIIMDWIEGQSLSEYIINNILWSDRLFALQRDFIRIFHKLNVSGIAHGDLNDKNIRVNPSGEITIIDIEHIWYEDFGNVPDEGADLNFQHPLRTQNKMMCRQIDYFSQIIIVANIAVACEDSDLYLKYVSNGNIFNENDFNNPESSALLVEMSQKPQLANIYKLIIEAIHTKAISHITPIDLLA